MLSRELQTLRPEATAQGLTAALSNSTCIHSSLKYPGKKFRCQLLTTSCAKYLCVTCNTCTYEM